MNFEVEEWLRKIVAVKYEGGISRLLQQLRWSTEIESFLRRLETNLRALVSSHRKILVINKFLSKSPIVLKCHQFFSTNAKQLV